MTRAGSMGRGAYKPSGWFVAGLYVVLSLGDLVFSLAAFSLGVPEANPVVAGLAQHGLFVPAKLVLALAIAVPVGVLYARRVARPAVWSALAVMALVNIYHIWGLSALLALG